MREWWVIYGKHVKNSRGNWWFWMVFGDRIWRWNGIIMRKHFFLGTIGICHQFFFCFRHDSLSNEHMQSCIAWTGGHDLTRKFDDIYIYRFVQTFFLDGMRHPDLEETSKRPALNWWCPNIWCSIIISVHSCSMYIYIYM